MSKSKADGQKTTDTKTEHPEKETVKDATN